MSRIKVTITGYYEIAPEQAEAYGSADPVVCARVDQEQVDANHVGPADVLAWIEDDMTIKIEAEPQGFGEDIAVVEMTEDGEGEFHASHPAEDHETGHDHLHGHGDGQHTHDGWEPSKVVERLRRDGFCGAEEHGGYCMARTGHCPRHETPENP